jgi:glutamate/tyrosine decarboxylase-like PLP-dependent enzyme
MSQSDTWTQQGSQPQLIADRALLSDTAQHAIAYLEGITNRRVSPSDSSIEALIELGGPLAELPCSPKSVLELLNRFGSPATAATAGGRYFGFVMGGAHPASVAASWLASAWDQNAAMRVMSPVGAELEDIALGWVRDLLGLPIDAGGSLVTGASMANFIGLAAARHALLERAGWDVEKNGLMGAPPLTVIVNEEAHPAIFKALGLLGLGQTRVQLVPTDSQGRMRAEALPALNDRTIVCIQAGNVNTGGFDPAGEICSRARETGAWVHVDGAFGLWAAVSPNYRHLTRGVEQADSWATDGHKWPNVGYDCGIAFVRDARSLRSALTFSAPYLTPGQRREPSHYTPELSRRARGVELWATLRSLGRSGLIDLIDRTCAHAKKFGEGLRASGFEVLNDVVINQVLVSFGDPAFTRAVIAEIQRDGTCWCGGTEWQGRTAMRISVSSWATTDHDVEASLAAIRRSAEQCRLLLCK